MAQRAQIAPALHAALVDASQGRVILVPGAVLIRDADGEIIGAVGISGDLPDNDEAVQFAVSSKPDTRPIPVTPKPIRVPRAR